MATDAMAALETIAPHMSEWSTVRYNGSAMTFGRTRTAWENGHLVSVERQQLTLFAGGSILLYVTDDTHPDAPWFGRWERVRGITEILATVGGSARTDIVEY